MKTLLSIAVAVALLSAPAGVSAQGAREFQAARLVGLAMVLANAETQATCNLNQDSADEIAAAVPDISPTLAQRIVSYRTRNGKFTDVLDVLGVPGLDSEIVRRNWHRISL